jgi:hypothetical protein
MLLGQAGKRPDGEGAFSPEASPAAMHTTLTMNLRYVQDWLNDKDFASAAQGAQGLGVLAQLYAYQSPEARWRQRTDLLRAACERLTAAARRKDGPGCDKAARECAGLLADLAKEPPTGARVSAKKFQPFGSTKTWMLLMEGAYVDAKSSKSATEIKQLAEVIADEVSVVAHLKEEAGWQKISREVRDSARQVVLKTEGGDLAGAKAALKVVYQRCEACHNGYKR